MDEWRVRVRVEPGQVRLLVNSSETGDLLKANLPSSPQHPRALLTLLEGLALYRGKPLHAALIAESDYPRWLGSGLFGDELWPGESQLVQFHVVAPGRRRCIDGLGSFRALREAYRGER